MLGKTVLFPLSFDAFFTRSTTILNRWPLALPSKSSDFIAVVALVVFSRLLELPSRPVWFFVGTVVITLSRSFVLLLQPAGLVPDDEPDTFRRLFVLPSTPVGRGKKYKGNDLVNGAQPIN